MTLGVYRLPRTPCRSGIDKLREQMAHREERFLQLAASRVFANPRNPYCELFRLAGCELGDLGIQLFNSSGARLSTAGQNAATTTSSRQLQRSARYSF